MVSRKTIQTIKDSMLSFSYPIVANDLMGTEMKYVQYRFPRSKKKRIREKWAKQGKNYKYRTFQRAVYYNNTLYVSKAVFNRLMEETKP